MRTANSLVPLLVLAACSTERPPEATGAFAAAHATFSVTDSTRARTLTVETWYPTARADAPTGTPPTAIGAYLADAAQRARYDALLDAAPAGCPTRVLGALRDAIPAGDRWPVLMLSHCHGCLRFELATVAEHLATHGFAIVAPDHAGNSLWEALDGENAPFTAETLAMRVADIRFVLDRVLDPAAPELPASLRGRFDATRVGMVGHSFGSVTSGAVARDDGRIRAVAGLAAPMESPLLPFLVMEDIRVPLLLAVAMEDNTIEEIGNDYLRENFENAGSPAWRLDLADAGHFSFTDIAGLRDEFMPGCGVDERQVGGATFTYPPVAEHQHTVAAWLTAFFGAHLDDRPLARAFLEAPPPLPHASFAVK